MAHKHSAENTPITIAIIGGGFSGTMVATHLLKQANHPLNITLIERRPEVGRGIAYSTPLDTHLLNVSVAKMSAFPNDPNHFLRWLQDREQPVEATSFVSRGVYGDYIQSIFRDAVANAASVVHLESITTEAVALKPYSKGAIIFLSSGDTLYADKVVLALGNIASSLPASLRSGTTFSKLGHFIREAWSPEALCELPTDAPILLVGTGLTMADMVVALRQNGHQGKIYAVSRHGLLPQCHQLQPAYSPFLTIETAPNNIRALLRRVRQEVQTASANGQDWRSVIDALRPITQALWQRLPLIEQKRFLRHVKSYWEVHRHRIAQEIATLLDEAMQCNQLVCWAGRIETCQDLGDRVAVSIRHRGSNKNTVLYVQYIINCTGSTEDYRRLNHPLITSLKNQQLIRLGMLMGIDTTPTGAVIDAKGHASNWLYTIGTARKGMLWETTAVPELREQAQELSQVLTRSVPIPTPVSENSFIFRQLLIDPVL